MRLPDPTISRTTIDGDDDNDDDISDALNQPNTLTATARAQPLTITATTITNLEEQPTNQLNQNNYNAECDPCTKPNEHAIHPPEQKRKVSRTIQSTMPRNPIQRSPLTCKV